jgi:hypothetical protein
MPDSLNPDRLAARCEPDDVAFLLPRHDFPADPGSIAHELLHIRRFGLEAVPMLESSDQVVDFDGSFSVIVGTLGNALEHLVIVPIEIDLVPERRDYWEGILSRMWDQYDKMPRVLKTDLERFAVVGYAATVITTSDRDLASKAETAISKDGLLVKAKACAEGAELS